MPFDYAEYQEKCNTLSTEQLQKEWENYTRQIAGGATSTATSVLFSPLTAGISLVGLGLSAPRIHNARKKREIIEKGLQDRGSTHNTRSRDVAGSMAVSGIISVATLGLAGPLADAAAGEAVGKGVEYAVAHVALDGVGAGIEHVHDGHLKKKGEQELKMKAMQAQLAGYQGQQVLVNNGQPMQTQMNYQGQHMQYQAPALTTGMALPQPGILMQNQQQIQWQPQQGLQIPGMQQPQMGIPGQPGFVPPMRPHSAAPDNQYVQYNVVGQNQPQQQYAPVPIPQQYSQQTLPQYQQTQQTDGKYQLNVVPNPQQQEQQQTWPNEKSAAYTYTAQDDATTPLPLYSQSVEHHDRSAHPDHIDLPAPPTMEEEIAFLKAKLLQMELEKRGMSATISGPLEISLDGGPKAKPQVQEIERPVGVQEVSAPGQTPPQDQQNGFEKPGTLQRKNTISSLTGQKPQSAPIISNERVASPEVQQPYSAPSVQQAHPQSAPPLGQNQGQPQHAQYAPVPNQESQYAQANQPQYTSSQPIQNHQRQGSVVSARPQEVPAHQRQGSLASPAIQRQSVSPAPQQYQNQTPAPEIQSQYQAPAPPPQQQQQQQQQPIYPQQQTQTVPIYQPQPVNPQLQAQQTQSPQQQTQPLQQQTQYAPNQVSSPQIQQQPQYAQQQQQQFQQNQKYPPVQRQDSGYYSQAGTPVPVTPLSRPVSSISSISSISSPVGGRHPSISTGYSPYNQPPQQQTPGYQSAQPVYNAQQNVPQQAQYNPQQQQQQQTQYNPQQQAQQPQPQYQAQPQQQVPYNPQQQAQQYNPQNHGRSQSVASFQSQTAPPPYFAPPPSGPQPVLADKGRDYFGNTQQQQHPSFPQYGQVGVGGQRGSVVGPPQGWQQQQWSNPTQQPQIVRTEPNYGPPPPVPGMWRG